MNSSVIIVGIIFLIGIGLVLYKYSHRKSLHDNVDQLKNVIGMIYAERETDLITQNKLIKGLKVHLGINEKMALKLIGKARHENLVEPDLSDIHKSGKIRYKKNF
jgi:hypothetical protein